MVLYVMLRFIEESGFQWLFISKRLEYGQWNLLVELIDEDCEATRRTFRANASYYRFIM